jgi:hypothetical protein
MLLGVTDLNSQPATSVVVKDLYGAPIDTTIPKSLKRQKFNKEPSALVRRFSYFLSLSHFPIFDVIEYRYFGQGKVPLL